MLNENGITQTAGSESQIEESANNFYEQFAGKFEDPLDLINLKSDEQKLSQLREDHQSFEQEWGKLEDQKDLNFAILWRERRLKLWQDQQFILRCIKNIVRSLDEEERESIYKRLMDRSNAGYPPAYLITAEEMVLEGLKRLPTHAQDGQALTQDHPWARKVEETINSLQQVFREIEEQGGIFVEVPLY